MRVQSDKFAVLFAGLTSAVALVLVVNRGGLIAWGALLIGCALLVKIRLKPSGRDLRLSAALAALSVMAWLGTHYYVIAQWESGEVVELTVETSAGAHTARLWVLDIGPDPLVYYEAEPGVAEYLLAGSPVLFNRSGEVSVRIPETKQVNALSDDETGRILAAMETKYGELNRATVIRHVLLEIARDRLVMVPQPPRSTQ